MGSAQRRHYLRPRNRCRHRNNGVVTIGRVALMSLQGRDNRDRYLALVGDVLLLACMSCHVLLV
jgi:hypothetical protein